MTLAAQQGSDSAQAQFPVHGSLLNGNAITRTGLRRALVQAISRQVTRQTVDRRVMACDRPLFHLWRLLGKKNPRPMTISTQPFTPRSLLNPHTSRPLIP